MVTVWSILSTHCAFHKVTTYAQWSFIDTHCEPNKFLLCRIPLHPVSCRRSISESLPSLLCCVLQLCSWKCSRENKDDALFHIGNGVIFTCVTWLVLNSASFVFHSREILQIIDWLICFLKACATGVHCSVLSIHINSTFLWAPKVLLYWIVITWLWMHVYIVFF